MGELRDITQEEWDAYDWIEITTLGDDGKVWQRDIKDTPRPNDGYVYYDATKWGDTVRVWRRKRTPVIYPKTQE